MIEFDQVPLPDSEGARPIIIIQPEIQDSHLPYSVAVDADGIVSFLKDIGINDEQIASTKINVKRKAHFNPFFFTGAKITGSYTPLSRDLTIYTDWVWERHEQTMNAAKRIANHRKRPILDKRLIKKRVATNRLPEYLEKAPGERALEFASALAWKAEQKKMDGVFLHEVGHKRDHEWPPNISLLFYGYGLKIESILAIFASYNLLLADRIPSTPNGLTDLVAQNAAIFAYSLPLLRVEYEFDLLERSARRYDASFDGKRPRFITITPKKN